MADQRDRRIGCGCLPLLGLFFVGSLALRGLDAVTDVDDGLIAAAVIGALVLLGVVGAIRRRRRRTEASDVASDGIPTPTREAEVSYIPPPVGPTPGPRIELPAPTDEEPETRMLRRRLSEAVSDIAKEVERTEPGAPPLSSEEMIARAKRRIADWQ